MLSFLWNFSACRKETQALFIHSFYLVYTSPTPQKPTPAATAIALQQHDTQNLLMINCQDSTHTKDNTGVRFALLSVMLQPQERIHFTGANVRFFLHIRHKTERNFHIAIFGEIPCHTNAHFFLLLSKLDNATHQNNNKMQSN